MQDALDILDTRQAELQRAHDIAAQELAKLDHDIAQLTARREATAEAIRRVKESSVELGVIRTRISTYHLATTPTAPQE